MFTFIATSVLAYSFTLLLVDILVMSPVQLGPDIAVWKGPHN